ncbi:collagen type IV alpha-3-binding protein-like [Orbicella faveolata]|uniref:collagen type IV alpha-3-binding protein-like n=1 Tax=Orbicella faveolata TaxID=48498 RepID=UPI0009E5196F|nr:collagen type IV alpha-3-binding protein-like [Orbicella faveolata]
MSGEHTPSLSDEEEDDLDCSNSQPQLPELQDTLSKWTNYLHGWQERWVVLSGGTLSYYKSEYDTAFGCRGSMSVAKATIQPHEFDECRFDVSVNDCMYYLRAPDVEIRQKWVDGLEAVKAAESGYGSESSLRKGGSMLSLSSVTSLSTTASSSSFKKGRGLREKLMELETFRDIVCQQIDTLQSYFDACAGAGGNHKQPSHVDGHDRDLFGSNDGLDHDADDEMDELSTTPTPATLNQIADNLAGRRAAPDGFDNPVAVLSIANAKGVDFRGESITFKATTAGILATLQHCIDIMNKREDHWQRRLDKEIEKHKKAETAIKSAVVNARKQAFIGGPDFEEGPHSALNEEEFYDAIETALDRQDEEDAIHDDFQGSTFVPPSELMVEEPPHRLKTEVDESVKASLQIVLENVDHNWNLVYEDGDLKVHRRDYEEGGIVLDPMKATHTVQGVTAREMAHYFFDKDVRMDWETTLESSRVLEQLSESSVIMHQIYKRVWPSSQRDTVFLSHIREIPSYDAGERQDNEVGRPWIVCNNSLDHPDAPTNKFVRAMITVALFCQTFIEPREEGQKLTRDHISCQITYTANVNPGGWAPPSVVRAVSKREYPKFLRKISSFCQNACKDKPITM